VFQNKEAEAAFADFLERNDLSENKEIFLVFYQAGSGLDKSGLSALLKKKAACQEFPRLEGAALARWISKEAADKGAEPDHGVASLFSLHFGNDLRKISNELEKLACYGKKITKENFYLLSPVFAQSDSFQFVDSLLKGDQARSLFLLDKCFESGIKETMLLGAVASNFRSALKIKSLLSKEKSSDALAKKAGVHPFVVKKLTPFAKMVSEEALKKIHSRVLRADSEIKRGKTEPKAALNLLVFDVISLLRAPR
ncbi:MAG: DNA polymerase III subunit delta, partial [Patescibacteria group bacterium]